MILNSFKNYFKCHSFRGINDLSVFWTKAFENNYSGQTANLVVHCLTLSIRNVLQRMLTYEGNENSLTHLVVYISRNIMNMDIT